MTFEQFETFLMSEECFANHDVSYIDYEGKQHYLDHEYFWSYFPKLSHLLTTDYTIKVEQMERYFGYEDRTVHAFYNKKNGPSFDLHTDPIDVTIECLDGKKYLQIDNQEVILEPNQRVIIPANTLHKALNYEKALMISHGIGDTETLTRIR